jgi:uncharacterized protein (DUF2236 family)
MNDVTPEDSVARRVNAERIVVLGWPRAILLQLAHPLVAAGVHDHSTFRAGGWTAVTRLHHTIRAMLALTFGGDAARRAALDGIRAIHRRVNGELAVHTGIFPARTRYSAEDPELVLWVHATLLETIPMTYARLVEPLTAAELDLYCDEAASIAIELGAHAERVPRTWEALQRYLAATYGSGAIAVGDQARQLADAVLTPPFAPFVAPVALATRVLTIGLLPEHLRSGYGYAWAPRDDRRLKLISHTLRKMRTVTPVSLALWPEAR